MKVIQVNCVYKKGSTGKIMYDIHTELIKRDIESVVCYGRGTKIDEVNVYKTCAEIYSKFNNFLSRFTGLMYGGCFFSTNKLINIIKKENPDIVHLQCINGYFVNIYRLITWLKNNNIKTVLTLHAEFMYTANCGHSFECDKWEKGCGNCPRFKKETKSYFFDNTYLSWIKMKKAFTGFNENLIIISVSPWLMERAKKSPFLADKNHQVVLNGIDTNVFHTYDKNLLKSKHNITNEKIIFHATAGFTNEVNNIKGGYYILELAKKLINENVKIFVAGTYDTSIIPPPNLIFLGKIFNQELLAKYYALSDLTVIASKKETFSMICAESLCCGTPIVGFKAGAPEQISLPEYSEFVEYGDEQALFEAVTNWLKKDLEKNIICEEAKEVYSKEKMCEGYVRVYEQIN